MNLSNNHHELIAPPNNGCNRLCQLPEREQITQPRLISFLHLRNLRNLWIV